MSEAHNADWYREWEAEVDEFESVFGASELDELLKENRVGYDAAFLRCYISDRIMRLEIEDITREARTHVGGHQGSFTYPGELPRENVGSVSNPNLKEKRMSQSQVSPNPIKGAAALTEPSTPSASPSEYGFLRRLIDSWSAPMPVVSGSTPAPQDNQIPRPVAPQDVELLERTKHVRLKGEKLMQFFARTGLGASQIRTMSYNEIKKFCATVEENAEQQPRYFQEPLPNKIRIHIV